MKLKKISLKKKKLLLMAVCMLAAGICYSCSVAASDGSGRSEGPVELLLSEEAGTPEASGEARREDQEAREASLDRVPEAYAQETGTEAVQPEEACIYVHVCGSVERPGVYELSVGSRVYEAVEAAGGFAEEASVDFLNLAMEAGDGMKIEVPTVSQAEQWRADGITGMTSDKRSAAASPAVVNLNTAALEELMTLKGIGQSRAEDIIRYREANGPFRSIEDVMKVPGIKEGAFEKIKDSISV